MFSLYKMGNINNCFFHTGEWELFTDVLFCFHTREWEIFPFMEYAKSREFIET